jgi:predicted nucleic acid-binding protein
VIVVDASVAAKWVLAEPHSDKAEALHLACARAAEPIAAPPLLPIEVTNILRQRMRREGLALTDAVLLLQQFLAFPVALVAPAHLHEDALVLAETYNLPAVYDAHYVALAQALGCDLWTADRRLVSALASQLPFVKWIGAYQQP